MGEFNSKVAGVSKDGRQYIIKKHVYNGQPLWIIPEPDNPYDPNAVGVWVETKGFLGLFKQEFQIGYLNRKIAKEISAHLRNGGSVMVWVTQRTGGSPGESFGVNILIRKL
ncbi:MAG: HIRAN domain-containing protein [Pseudomonadales bacterium]|nr:HIRAN domain-containing protein [Pseudomonadales bacterium]